MLLTCGMKDAKSNHACIYCVSNKRGYFKGAAEPRTSFRTGEPGVGRSWLLTAIPVERIVIDVLHMFLRTTDKLLMMICREVPAERATEFVRDLQQQITCQGKIVAMDGKVEFQNCDSSDRSTILQHLISSDCLVNFLSKKRGAQPSVLLLKYLKALDTLREVRILRKLAMSVVVSCACLLRCSNLQWSRLTLT